jgi:hypothetical protein
MLLIVGKCIASRLPVAAPRSHSLPGRLGWSRRSIKSGESKQAIGSSHTVAGVVFVALSVVWAAILFNGHDREAAQLNLFGLPISLGEDHESDDRKHRDEHDEHDEHDD